LSRPFHFKQFSIEQTRTPMKVGTDGVLLGAWCTCGPVGNALDIGTGTGVISLMIAQRNPTAKITGIDPDPNAIAEARRNFLNSPWSERLEAIETKLQEFDRMSEFDLIVSNPPFFENSLKPPSNGRTTARHTVSLAPKELVAATALLSKTGVLSGIYPVDTFDSFDKLMTEINFHPQRVTFVKPTPNKETHRVLFEYKEGKENIPATSELIIEQAGRHHYSDEYIELTKDFYLKM